MRKGITGGTLLAVSMVLALHPPQILTGDNKLHVIVKQGEMEDIDTLVNLDRKIQQETADIPSGQVPINWWKLLMATPPLK
jgi:hypothetical protein